MNMNLGNNILKQRKQAQLSQEQLGDKIGVTRQTISNWELNETIPDAKQLLALSKELQISIDVLVDNDIQNILEQKVNSVENNMMKNNTLLKVLFALSLIIVFLIIAFISAN